MALLDHAEETPDNDLAGVIEAKLPHTPSNFNGLRKNSGHFAPTNVRVRWTEALMSPASSELRTALYCEPIISTRSVLPQPPT